MREREHLPLSIGRASPQNGSQSVCSLETNKTIIKLLIWTCNHSNTKHDKWCTKLFNITVSMLPFPIGPRWCYPVPSTLHFLLGAHGSKGHGCPKDFDNLEHFLLTGYSFILLSLVWINRGWPEDFSMWQEGRLTGLAQWCGTPRWPQGDRMWEGASQGTRSIPPSLSYHPRTDPSPEQ